MKNFVIVISLLLLLSGCSMAVHHGPMHTKHGLIKTNAFDPLFAASINYRTTDVKYKVYAGFRNKQLGSTSTGDTIVITDIGVFLVEWNTVRLKFDHKFELPYSEIIEVTMGTEKKSLSYHQYLEIKTVKKDQYKFIIYDGTADRAKQLIESQLSH